MRYGPIGGTKSIYMNEKNRWAHLIISKNREEHSNLNLSDFVSVSAVRSPGDTCCVPYFRARELFQVPFRAFVVVYCVLAFADLVPLSSVCLLREMHRGQERRSHPACDNGVDRCWREQPQHCVQAPNNMLREQRQQFIGNKCLFLVVVLFLSCLF